MEKHTIGGLKNILVNATDFSDVQDYFLTLTETNMHVIEGKAGKNKVLQQIVVQTITKIAQQLGLIEKGAEIMTITNMFMVEVRQRNFWHGSGMINSKHIFTFFYFADLDKGMVAAAKGSNCLFARVSIKEAASKTNPMAEFSDN
jgi:hypothetical protein